VGVQLSISVPRQWTSFVPGATRTSVTIADPVAPGASGERDLQGHLGARGLQRRPGRQGPVDEPDERREAIRDNGREGAERQFDQINEFRIARFSTNPTDSFIELYNAGAGSVDISTGP